MHAHPTTSPTHFVSERCICLVGSEAMTEHQATTAQQSSREWLKVVTSIAIEYNMLCFQYYPDVRWPTHPLQVRGLQALQLTMDQILPTLGFKQSRGHYILD